MARIDPDLVGIWIVSGEPRTYEVMADGTYHVANAEEALRFDDAGATMIWGPRRYDRLVGSGETPLGTWKDTSTDEEWRFFIDGSFEVSSGEASSSGIWALRNGDAALWTRELCAEITSNGAEVTFTPVGGETVKFGYTVKDGVWVLLDVSTWQILARYARPEVLAKAG